MKYKKLSIATLSALIFGLISSASAVQLKSSLANNASTPAVISNNATKAISLPVQAKPSFVEDEILVTFKNTLSSTNVDDLLNSMSVSSSEKIGKQNVRLIKVSNGLSVQQAVNSFAADSNVIHAQPNYRYYATAIPNDASYSQVWALNNTAQQITKGKYPINNPGVAGNDMDAELAWEHITDCSNTIVAVLDTGINYQHEDLIANMWNSNDPLYPNHGFDYFANDNDPMASDGSIHGTHVAGTIGARGNNEIGSTGVCWNVQIMALRVLGPQGGSTAGIIKAIEFASDNGAHIINMSLGSAAAFDLLFSDSISYARDRNVVVIVAAGNSATNTDTQTTFYPCNFTQDNLICVAALDQSYALANFSNTGTTSVDVGAPGTNIMSTWPGTKLEVTSFTGWIRNGGWGHNDTCVLNPAAGPRVMMMNPSNWVGCGPAVPGNYSNNENSIMYNNFNLSGLLGARISAQAFIDTELQIDFMNAYSKAAGGNPTNPFPIATISGSTNNFSIPAEFSLEDCLTATCTFGVNLTSNATITKTGIAIFDMVLQKTEANSAVYESINGTSMASPNVAGVAALVRAYNPNFSYQEIVNAILGGGQNTPSLSTTTVTGKAVNAMGSLSFINVPTGVTVVAQ